MILDQLLEKKDLSIYIKVKREYLRGVIKETNRKLCSDKYSRKQKKKLMGTLKQLKGRILKLNTLMGLLHENRLKEQAKRYWKYVKYWEIKNAE